MVRSLAEERGDVEGDAAARAAVKHRRQLWWVLFAAAMWSIAASFVNLLLGGRTYVEGSTGGLVHTGPGDFLQKNADFIGAGLMLPVILANARRQHSNTKFLWWALLPWLVWRVEDFSRTQSLSPVGMNLAIPVTLLALWSLNLRWRDLEVLGYAVTGLATFALLMIPFGDKAWSYAGTADKAIIGSRTLAGPFGDMNTLGMTAALGLPFIVMMANKRHRNWSLLIVLLVVLLASSRTSLVAVGVGLAVILLLSWARTMALKKILLALIATIIGLATWYLPETETDPTAFTTRGAIWMAARRLWNRHPWSGLGMSEFGKDGEISEHAGLVVYHGHNLFVSTMTIGGYFLVIASALALVLMMRRAISFADISLGPVMACIVLLTLGIAEMPWRLDEFGGMGWIGWSVFGCVLLVTADADREPDRPADKEE